MIGSLKVSAGVLLFFGVRLSLNFFFVTVFVVVRMVYSFTHSLCTKMIARSIPSRIVCLSELKKQCDNNRSEKS